MTQTSNHSPKNLAQKMYEIMQDVERIEKDKRNTHQNYEYASEKIIKETIHAQLVEKRILFQLNALQSTIENNVTWTKFSYSFSDIDSTEVIKGEFIGTGNGRDDKGYYASVTGAIKYIMTSTFLIPTGDDPEEDKNEIKPRVAYNNQPIPVEQHIPMHDVQDEYVQESPEENLCPQCGGMLVVRQGKYGAFKGCSNYPTCNYIQKKKK